jgi:hypothetical protein
MQVAAKFLKTVQPSNNYLQHGDDLEHVYFRGQRRKKLQTSLLCTLMATRWICGMSSECAWSQNKCFWTLDASGCCVTDDKVNTGNIRCLETVLGDDSLPLGLVEDGKKGEAESGKRLTRPHEPAGQEPSSVSFRSWHSKIPRFKVTGDAELVLDYKLSDTLLYCTILITSHHSLAPPFPRCTGTAVTLPQQKPTPTFLFQKHLDLEHYSSTSTQHPASSNFGAECTRGAGSSSTRIQGRRPSLQYQSRFSGAETRTQDPKIPKSGPSAWLLDQSIHPVNQFREARAPAESSKSHILTSCDKY